MSEPVYSSLVLALTLDEQPAHSNSRKAKDMKQHNGAWQDFQQVEAEKLRKQLEKLPEADLDKLCKAAGADDRSLTGRDRKIDAIEAARNVERRKSRGR